MPNDTSTGSASTMTRGDAAAGSNASNGVLEQIRGDILMGEFVAATSATEELGELLTDASSAAQIVQRHAARQWQLAGNWLTDVFSAREFGRLVGAHLHFARATTDNQLSLAVDLMRLQAEGIARTRHILAVSAAALERAVAGPSDTHRR